MSTRLTNTPPLVALRRAPRALAGRVRHRRRRVPTILALLLVAAGLQSLAWDVALPAFQGPDEDAHFAYVQHLAETGTIPSSSIGNAPNSTEVALELNALNLHALMGDPGARPAWSSADLAYLHHVEATLPKGARADGSGQNPEAKNPPLYYALMAIPYRMFVWLPLLKRLFILRLFSALCYLATITLTWLLAGELFGRVRWKQTLAAGAVALEPQLAFTSVVINADNLLITLCTATLLACVRLVTRGPTVQRVLIAAGLSAGAALTQGRGLVTVPVLGVAIAVAWLRHRPALRAGLVQAALAVGCVLAALLFDYIVATGSGGGSLYGGQVKSLNASQFSLSNFASFTYQFFFPRLASMTPRIGPAYGYRQVFIETFFGKFGWLEVSLSPKIYDFLQVASALGLVGLYTASIVRWRRLRASWAPVVVMAAMGLTQVVFLLYVSYQALLGDAGTDPLIVGRYLLPIVSLFGLAIAFTIGSLPRRVGSVLATGLLSGGILLMIACIGVTATRFYA